MKTHTGQPPETHLTVEIIVDGLLDRRWSVWLDALDVTVVNETQTRIHGALPDQAALFGVLFRLHNMGLSLVSFRRIASDERIGDDR
jgi:hypothetical protein